MGAILIAGLGLAVLFFRPLRPQQKAFAWYAIAFGLATGASRVTDPARPAFDGWLWFFITLVTPIAAIAVVLLGARHEGAHVRRSAWLWPGLAFAVVALGFFLAFRDGADDAARAFGVHLNPFLVSGWAGLSILVVAIWMAAVRIALAARAGDEHHVRQAALMTTALAIYPAVFVTGFFFFPANFGFGSALAAFVGSGWLAGTWLYVGPRCGAPKVARNAALAPLAFALLGLLLAANGFGQNAGYARIATVLLLAYAILRHHVMGIDVKIRWGISRGTVAAIFIAVFFVTSEAAQQFFGDRFNDHYLGIAAAGILVLGIAPLQRFADRVAEKALPTARAGGMEDRRAGMDLYERLAARLAADGTLSADDESTLAYVAEHMGIGAGRANDVIHRYRP